jgi:hypothetical protein
MTWLKAGSRLCLAISNENGGSTNGLIISMAKYGVMAGGSLNNRLMANGVMWYSMANSQWRTAISASALQLAALAAMAKISVSAGASQPAGSWLMAKAVKAEIPAQPA